MALSQADLDKLDKAISAQALEIELDGVRMRYRSLSDLLKARAHVAQQIAAAAPHRAGSTHRFRFTTLRDG
jgi:chorismate mutase